MRLVQLYKANDDAPIEGVLSTKNCNTNYINSQNYLHELTLCNAWDHDTRNRLLIKKRLEEIIIRPLQNERFMNYSITIMYNFSDAQPFFISLEYLENTDFFINFYVSTKILVRFDIPVEISSSPNPIMALLQYIRGKTLNIGIIGNETPKYSIVFDNNCKYYLQNDPDYIIIFAIKKPFLILIVLPPSSSYIYMMINVKPRLIEEFNDYTQTLSNYNPVNDQSLKVDDIVNNYFDSSTKVGLSRNGVDINNDTDNFSYSLVRALLGTFKNDIVQNYYFKLGDNTGMAELSSGDSYMPLAETPLCIYFPLFRPQLDNNGFTMTWPQYEPNDTSKYVYSFHLSISLNSGGVVNTSILNMVHGNSLLDQITCFTSPTGYVPSWRFDSCDLTLPFRFANITECSPIARDNWDNFRIRHNANYLFRIIKPSSSNPSVYNIKGIGCNELTTDIYSFSDFMADYEFSNSIHASGLNEIQRITFSESGYPIDAISDALANSIAINDETIFVLFNESLVENASDFTSIYQAVTYALPNSVVCYIGRSETVPDSHRNKIIHSNAIVTDLNTNQQMPLVIKYIRYAKRLHELFNG
jgi:hypothetical protein